MKLELNLRKHCVKTELKRLYNRSLSEYFKPGSNREQLEKIIDVLKTVLENSNFSNLRGMYPELAGKSEANVILTTHGQDHVVISINGIEMKLPAASCGVSKRNCVEANPPSLFELRRGSPHHSSL